MIRRKHEEESHNHERWVISYADFITLLFAFFVVMYSISSVNDGKYKVLSDSLENVFSEKAKTLLPIQVGNDQLKVTPDRVINLPVPGDFPSKEDFKYSVEGLFDDVEVGIEEQGEGAGKEGSGQEATGKEGAGDDTADIDAADIDAIGVAGAANVVTKKDTTALEALAADIESTLMTLINDKLATVNSTDDWIEVDIRSSVLFPSGGAAPSSTARKIILEVAQLLKEYDNPIHVEGFTDDIPIQNEFYPSNWELSAARAAAIVRVLELGDVESNRMAAVGYAEYRPVADNSTEEGRAKNRRVALIISKSSAGKEAESATASPRADNFKVGAVPDKVDAQSGERQNAFDPQSRKKQTDAKNETVPLKIIKLDNGGILFSTESTEPR